MKKTKKLYTDLHADPAAWGRGVKVEIYVPFGSVFPVLRVENASDSGNYVEVELHGGPLGVGVNVRGFVGSDPLITHGPYDPALLAHAPGQEHQHSATVTLYRKTPEAQESRRKALLPGEPPNIGRKTDRPKT
jgi:hypothetical protein